MASSAGSRARARAVQPRSPKPGPLARRQTASVWPASRRPSACRKGESIGLQRLIGPLVRFTLIYFAFNSGLVAIAIGIAQADLALESGRTTSRGCRSTTSAALQFRRSWSSSIQRTRRWTFMAVVVPLLLILYMTFRASMARVADANHHIAELNQLYLATVQTWPPRSTPKTRSPTVTSSEFSTTPSELAVAIGIKNEIQLKAIQAAAVLHDTGKIAIPESILNKPGPLTTDEFAVMKQHATIGADIVSSVNFPILSSPSSAITMKTGMEQAIPTGWWEHRFRSVRAFSRWSIASTR